MTEADNYRAEMLQLGVEDSDILLERRSLNTFRNAEFTEAILKQQTFNKLFLVTSGPHLRRALLYFSYFGVYPTPCASDYVIPHMSILPVGYNFTIADSAAHEYVGWHRPVFPCQPVDWDWRRVNGYSTSRSIKSMQSSKNTV